MATTYQMRDKILIIFSWTTIGRHEMKLGETPRALFTTSGNNGKTQMDARMCIPPHRCEKNTSNRKKGHDRENDTTVSKDV